MPIEFAEQDRVVAVYDEALELIRLGLNTEVAFISDLTCVSDFAPDDEGLDKLSALVGRRVGRHDSIVGLAEEYSTNTSTISSSG